MATALPGAGEQTRWLAAGSTLERQHHGFVSTRDIVWTNVALVLCGRVTPPLEMPMPNPMPPADRKHGNGDRNDNAVAELDSKLQARRDKKKAEAAKEVTRQSHKDMGIEHP